MLTTTVKQGDSIPDFLHNHRLLPPGSRIKRNNSIYEVDAPGVFTPVDRNSGGFDHYMWTYPFNLSRLDPEQLTLPDYDEETLLWRIRDSALAAAERSSVRLPPVLEMVSRIGAEHPRFRLGEVISNHHDLAELPDKAVLYCGDPSLHNRFTVYRMRDQALVPVLGVMANRPTGAPVVLYEAKGIDAPPSVPVPGDKVAIAKLAMKAWRIGKGYKQNNSWCSVFEDTLTMLGIDDSVADVAGESTRGAGEVVTKEQAYYLPVGTLLAWRSEHNRAFAVYQRVAEKVRNVSGTRRVWGYEDNERNNHEQMMIIKMPGDEQARWQVPGTVIQNCPPGVTFHQTGYSDRPKTTPAESSYWTSYTITGWPVTS